MWYFDWQRYFTRKRLARKSCYDEYSPLGREFFDVFNHGEKEEPLKVEKEEPLTTDKLSLFYNNKYTFSEFKNIGKYVMILYCQDIIIIWLRLNNDWKNSKNLVLEQWKQKQNCV